MILNNKILAKTGYKNIKDLKVGDIVLSFNADKNINEYNKILNVFVNKVDKLYEIKINNKKISVSEEHPFYNGKDYIEAKDLKINDMVFTNEFKLVKIDEINEISNEKLLYNIEVENNHNYYIDSYLVHNFPYGGGHVSGGGGGMASPGVVLGGGGRSSGGHSGGNSPYAGNPGYVGGGYSEPLKQMPTGRWLPQSEYDKKMGEIAKHQAEITELNKEARILNELNDTAAALEREWRQSGTDIQTFLTQAGVPLKDQSTIIQCMNNAGKTGNNTNKRLIEIGEKRTKLENDIITKDGKIDNTKNPKIGDSYKPNSVNHSMSDFEIKPNQTIKYDPKSAQSAIDAATRLLNKASKFEEASDKYKSYSKGAAKDDKVNVKNGTSITKAGTNLVSALTTIQGEFEKSGKTGNSELSGLGNNISNLGGYPSSRGSTPGVVDFSGGRSGSKSGSSTPSAINYGSDPRYTNTGNPGLYLGGSGNSTSKPSSNQGTSSPKSTSPVTTGGGGTFLGGGNSGNNGGINFEVNNLRELSEKGQTNSSKSDNKTNWFTKAYYSKAAGDAVLGKGVLQKGATFIDGLRSLLGIKTSDNTLSSKVDQHYNNEVYNSTFYKKASEISGLDYHSNDAKVIETAGYMAPEAIIALAGTGAVGTAMKTAECASWFELAAPYLVGGGKGVYNFIQGVGEGVNNESNPYVEGTKEAALETAARLHPLAGVANDIRDGYEYYHSLSNDVQNLQTSSNQTQSKNEYGYDPQPAEIIFIDEIE